MTDGEVEGARYLERPTASVAASAIGRALDRGQVVSLVGECEVDGFDGGEPARGDRHALLKPDGAVILHGADGTAPIAAFQGDNSPSVDAVEDTLRLSGDAERARGLRFHRVDLLAIADVDDAAGTRTARSGRDRHGELRERLLSEPDLVEPGFRPRSTERETAAGPIDLFGHDADGRAVVVEVKARRAGPAAVGQLDRYVEALRRDLHAGTEVRGILVAPSATKRTRRLLAERGFEFRSPSIE